MRKKDKAKVQMNMHKVNDNNKLIHNFMLMTNTKKYNTKNLHDSV